MTRLYLRVFASGLGLLAALWAAQYDLLHSPYTHLTLAIHLFVVCTMLVLFVVAITEK